MVEKMFYSTSLKPFPLSLRGKLHVMPNTLYNIKVEILRNDLARPNKFASAIIINNKLIGSCNPGGVDFDCDFYDCAKGNSLILTTVRPTVAIIDVNITFTSDGWRQKCACNYQTLSSPGACGPEYLGVYKTKMSATARITLTPLGNKDFITF